MNVEFEDWSTVIGQFRECFFAALFRHRPSRRQAQRFNEVSAWNGQLSVPSEGDKVVFLEKDFFALRVELLADHKDGNVQVIIDIPIPHTGTLVAGLPSYIVIVGDTLRMDPVQLARHILWM